MSLVGLMLAIGAGLLVSLLPVLSWAQGEGLERQLWMIVCGHVLALCVLGCYALGTGAAFGGPRFVAVALVSGVCNGLNGSIYYAAVMRRGPVSISWSVVWMTAVVVAILGWVVVGEPIYAAQPVALACFVGCLTAMGWATYQANRQKGAVAPIRRGFWAYLSAAMIAGVAGVLVVKARPTDGGSDVAFVVLQLAGLVAALAGFALFRRLRLPRDRRTLWLSLAFGAVIGPHFVMWVAGLRLSDVSVFQPVLSGVALVAGTAWAVLRGERPSRLVLAGAALAIASIVLINLKFGLLRG
ncbi:MAG: hypothetical protein BIFFINMI_03640 [Phycisphaerae bacterium]|nr:hypothetical protein [Phycisphaerae bacterium]